MDLSQVWVFQLSCFITFINADWAIMVVSIMLVFGATTLIFTLSNSMNKDRYDVTRHARLVVDFQLKASATIFALPE